MKTAFRYLLYLLVALLLGTSSLYANPAFRRPIHVTQPDGSDLVVYLCGDEYFHFYQTQDQVLVCPDAERHFYYARRNEQNLWEASGLLAHEAGERSAEEMESVNRQKAEQLSVDPGLIRQERMAAGDASLLRSAQGIQPKVIKGERKVLTLLVQTSDVKFTKKDANAYFKRQFNESGFSDGGNCGSVRDYFIAQSDSLFQPAFDVYGPYTLSKTMDYYGENDETSGNDKHAREMVEEVCRLADEDVNYQRYDGDGDGSVDFICVIYAGEAESFTGIENQVWPHSSSLSPLRLDGVNMGAYAAANELSSVSGIPTICGVGVMCHEYSHVLGLKDAYDVDYTGNYGLYAWSLMDHGDHLNNSLTPCHYTAFEKECLGWTTIETLESETALELKPLSEGGKAYRLVNEDNPDEYYILENRQQQGWDAAIPGHGLLIMHIDYHKGDWNANKVNNHQPQGMTIVPADNEFSQTSRGAAGDPFPGTSGNTSLTDYSLPAALMHTGNYLHKPLSDIEEKDGVVTLNVMKGSASAPKANAATHINAYSFTASWSLVYGSSAYVVETYHILDVPEGVTPDVTLWNTRGVLQSSIRTKSNKTAVTGLEAGEWYAYRVRSIVQGNMSAYSNPVFVQLTTEETSLSAPETLRIDSLWDEGVRLSWTPVEEADRYVVEARRMEDSELYPEKIPQALLNESFQGLSRADGLDISRVMDIYADTLGWEGERISGCSEGCVVLTSGKAEEESSYLNSPYLAQSEGTVYLFFSARKYSDDDPDPVLYVMMGNDSDNRFYVFGATIPVSSTRWEDWYCEMPSLNTNTFFTFMVTGGARVCLDDVFTRLSYSDEKELSGFKCVEMSRMGQNVAPADTQTVEDRVVCFPTEEAYMVFDAMTSSTYRFRVRSVKDEVYSPYSEALDVPLGNTTFMQGDARYQYISRQAKTVSMMRNPQKSYSGDVVIPEYVVLNGDTLKVKTLADDLFRGCQDLHSVSVPAGITLAGDNLFRGCRKLCYVDWKTQAAVPQNSFVGANPNCLLYVDEEVSVLDTLVQVVRDSHIEYLFLSPLNDFCAPYPFFADNALYARVMNQKTVIGASAGWEAIAVPFDVDKVELNGSSLYPFNGTSEGSSFWLAQWGDKGFVTASSIKANTPYILSLPNSDSYAEADRLQGTVYFSASQVQVESTLQRQTLRSGTFSMTPVYEWSETLASDYVLNVYDAGIDRFYPGSVFSPGRMRAEPFSAVLHPISKAPAFYPVAFASDMPAQTFQIFYQNGETCFYSDSSESNLPLFSLDGRFIRLVHIQPGLNRLDNLAPGQYIFHNSIIVVK